MSGDMTIPMWPFGSHRHGTGEPPLWTRHPRSKRYRPDGDPEKEYVGHQDMHDPHIYSQGSTHDQ